MISRADGWPGLKGGKTGHRSPLARLATCHCACNPPPPTLPPQGIANGTLTVGDAVLFVTLMQQLYGPLNFFGTCESLTSQPADLTRMVVWMVPATPSAHARWPCPVHAMRARARAQQPVCILHSTLCLLLAVACRGRQATARPALPAPYNLCHAPYSPAQRAMFPTALSDL